LTMMSRGSEKPVKASEAGKRVNAWRLVNQLSDNVTI
jgi:hypothetical protein